MSKTITALGHVEFVEGRSTRRRVTFPNDNWPDMLIDDNDNTKVVGYAVVRFDEDDQFATIIPTPAETAPAGLWSKEHGYTYGVPQAIFDAGLKDVSWHNDMCPSFVWPEFDDEADAPMMFVDHFVPELRENESGKRYTVFLHQNGSCDGGVLIETDDICMALAQMRERRQIANPRFVWTYPCVIELFPDVPPELGGKLCLYDRQEKAFVVQVSEKYANAACLETTRASGGCEPFTELEKFFNGLDNEALESEGMPVTVAPFTKGK